MRHSASIALVAAAALLGAAPSAGPPALLALTHANVLDPLTGQARRNVTIIIDGRIRAVQSARRPVPGGARLIDMSGAWVLPGLIDAHVHFRDEESARRALRAGVTTARSLGADGFVDVRMAQRHAVGARDTPEVVSAGYHVRPRLADAFFTDFPELGWLRSGVSGPRAAREVVRANAARGVRFIKVMATQRAGTPDTDFRERALSDEELTAAASEAKRYGLPVAAHAHTDEGVRAALLGGARSIEHGTVASPVSLRLMHARGACLVPTLSFWADMAGPGGEYDHAVLADRARAMLPQARATVARARLARVKIAAGSDMRYDRTSPFGVADELMFLRDSGLAPLEAIRAGTTDAAACLGVASRTGSVQPGMEADLVILEGDPRKDLSLFKRPKLVINDGVVAP